MPKLHFIDKNFGGRTYDIVVEKTTVGRGDHNTLVIADESVSVNHCEILSYGEELIVRERGSSNGTFVDGVRVVGQMPIHNGQALRFGSVEARVEVAYDSGADTTTELTAIYEQAKVMRDRRREQKRPVQPHSKIEPSSSPSGFQQDEQTVLLPNPRSTQRIAPAAPAPDPASQIQPRTKSSLRCVVAAILALLAVLIIWLIRR